LDNKTAARKIIRVEGDSQQSSDYLFNNVRI